MAQNSNIEWTDNTWNPWIGCTKVSPGCANCYAEARDQRFAGGAHWGNGAPRQRTSAANWNQPLKWNREAAEDVDDALHDFGADKYEAPQRPRVFCASLADWLDDEVPIEWLADLLALIHATPFLDWQLLTKRPENYGPRIEQAHHFLGQRGTSAAFRVREWMQEYLDGNRNGAPNIWIGTSVEDQTRADVRIPALLKIPAVVRFLSCEPLLGPVRIDRIEGNADTFAPILWHPLNGAPPVRIGGGIDWVICGGESGPHARPMHPAWARSLRDQCQGAGVPFLFKQWGSWAPSGDRRLPDRLVWKFGKKAAGRKLDGREWNEFPR
jgi:protein gp37